MKIGLICPYSLTKGGGVQDIVHHLHDEMSKLGHEVKIITPRPLEIVGLDTTDIIFVGAAADFHSPLGTTSAVSSSIDPSEIDDMLEREKFDILHFHEPWVPFLSRQILSRSTCINVATVHAKVPETIVSRTVVKTVTPYSKSVLKYIDVFTAVSNSAAEYVRSLGIERIKIIPNAICIDDFSSKKVTPDTTHKKTILFVGRLERRKGVKYLLKALSVLNETQKNTELLVLGEGPNRLKLEQYAEQLVLPNVKFLGYLNDEAKIKLLREADLFVSPAIYGESFGITLLEAMASDLPIVAGDNPGYVDVLRDTGKISLVNVRDSIEFARRLDVMLNDTELRKVWLKWSTSYIKQFSYKNITAQYLQVYNQAIRNRSKAEQQIQYAEA